MIVPAKRVENIIISGLTAAGKTTHAKLLAEEYGFQYVSASQILLRLGGYDVEPPLDFWLTHEAFNLRERISWKSIDDEIRRLEAEQDSLVFDCLSLPWYTSRKSMIIWLESSLESRIMKAFVSHEGQGRFSMPEICTEVQRKDEHARSQMLHHYKVDLLNDRTPFSFIFDISEFIEAPTSEASQRSIRTSQKIISCAAQWYLESNDQSLKRFQACIEEFGRAIVKIYPH